MTDASRRTIALGQFGGSVLIVVGLNAGLALTPSEPLPIGAVMLAVLYALAALAGGLMLLNRRPLGAWLSLAVQAVQVVALTGPAATFWFMAGPFLGLRAGGGALRLEVGFGGVAWATLLTGPTSSLPGANFGFGSGFIQTDSGATVIAINAFAILATARLLRHLTADVAAEEPVRPMV